MNHKLAQRRKQIDLFKHSEVYQAYLADESPGKPIIPIPSPNDLDRSKRSFDGLVKEWKSRVYAWLEITRITRSDAYAFFIQYHPDLEEPNLFQPNVRQRVKVWGEMIERFYEEEYIFIPNQMCQNIECGNQAGFYEESENRRTFCSRSCQEFFYRI